MSAINVIKRGVVPELEPMQVTCRKCKSVLEFVPAAVKRIFDQRDGDFYSFDCPVCNATVTKAVKEAK